MKNIFEEDFKEYLRKITTQNKKFFSYSYVY